jgi:methylmalonyl-CoA mutase N-terminal domain/subunit
VAEIADPLGGSYFVESLTSQMEQNALRYFEKLDALGGMVKAIEAGYPQKEIAEASYTYQRAVEAGEKIIVGVNDYVTDESPHPILYIDESIRDAQTEKLRRLRERRSGETVQRSLSALCRAAEQDPQPASAGISAANTMPYLLDCVRASATLGEICSAFRDVYGAYQEPGNL